MTSKQPLAIICLSPNDGGMELDAIKLYKKLSKYLSVVLVSKKDSFIESQVKNDNTIKIETIDFQHMFSINIILAVRTIIKKHGIKNVIFFGASELRSLYFAFLGLKINLIVRHGTTKSRPKKDFFHRLIYSKVNYHVSISKHLQKNVKTIIPFGKQTKEKLIYSSFELSKLNKVPHKLLTIVHTGRIVEGKGQLDAIKACSILYKNNIDFIFYIVGSMDENFKVQFMEYYNSCEYKDNIKLTGFTKDVQNYLNKSDIFLFPSWGEGLGNSFLEALANGLVCMAYKNTSFIEFQQLGFELTLIENKSIIHLEEELLNIAQNLQVKKKNSLHNYSLIEKYFSSDAEVSKYLEILI